MEKRQFDVTALGELLIDFTENGFSSQATLLWKPIRVEPHVMFLPCWNVLEKKLLLSQSRQRYVRKSVKISG